MTDPTIYRRKPVPEAKPYASPAPDRVLANRPIIDLDDLVATCSPAKLAMGVTKAHQAGQVAWSWWATHGFGQRTADGKITESVRVRFDDLGPGTRGAVLLWTRPVPAPEVVRPLFASMALTGRLGFFILYWPIVAAVLRELPAPKWTLAYSTLFELAQDRRIADIPRSVSSVAVRAEVQRPQ